MKNWSEPEEERWYERVLGGEGSSESFSLNTLVAAFLHWFKGLVCLDLGISKSQLYWYTMIYLALKREENCSLIDSILC